MISVLKSKLDRIVAKTKTEIRDVPYRVRWKNQKHIFLILFIFLAQLKVCHFPLTFCFWTGFAILGCICYYGLILLFWAEFIMNWSKHFRLNCSRYYVLCFSFWNKYLILSWFCHSGLISSFWIELLTSGWRPILLFWVHLVVQGGLRHSTTLTFWVEFCILGRFCYSVLNLSFCTKFFIWVELVIPGWICQSGMICYSELGSF